MYVYTSSPHIFNAAGEVCLSHPKLISLSLLWVIPVPIFQKLIDLIDIHFPFYPIIYSFIGTIYHPSSYFSHFQKVSLYPEPPFTKYLTYRVSFTDIFFFKDILNLLCPFWGFCLHLRITEVLFSFTPLY